MMKLVIFWGSLLYFPFAALCLWALLRGLPAMKVVAALALAITSVLAYARFVEPRQLVTHRETIVLPGANESSPSIRIALFGDPGADAVFAPGARRGEQAVGIHRARASARIVLNWSRKAAASASAASTVDMSNVGFVLLAGGKGG